MFFVISFTAASGVTPERLSAVLLFCEGSFGAHAETPKGKVGDRRLSASIKQKMTSEIWFNMGPIKPYPSICLPRQVTSGEGISTCLGGEGGLSLYCRLVSLSIAPPLGETELFFLSTEEEELAMERAAGKDARRSES